MDQPTLAICLTTCDSNLTLWKQQLESLKRQSFRDWICLVQDDASSPRIQARLKGSLKGDRRFRWQSNPRRLGMYANFEAALRRVPPAARYVALCDHDDRWYPDKLQKSLALLEASAARLVYTNLRPVDASGHVLAQDNWFAPAGKRADLEMLSLANIVPGSGIVFRAELLPFALPFPKVPGACYHDHWLALVALSLGSLACVPEPQYDYVQHAGNYVGHGAVPRRRGILRRLVDLRNYADPAFRAQELGRARREQGPILQRAAHFAAELRRRLKGRLKAGADQELENVEAAAQSLPALCWLWARGRWRRRDFYGIENYLLRSGMLLKLGQWLNWQ